ncbi:EAL and HDOD domain-containing protein [Thermincola ferriacetica]
MDVFVARQPIFDRQQKVCGYELLYRMSTENQYICANGDQATSDLIANSFLLIGLETLTGGKKAYINFTENLLKTGLPTNLPPNMVAVEILEDVEHCEEITAACRKLKEMGFTLVLDDFVMNGCSEPLLEFADIVKIDFMNTTLEQRKNIIRKVGFGKIEFLAEKVETQEEFEQALEMGYTYFQGYFFSKPVIMSCRDVPVYKLNYLRILQEVNRPDVDIGSLDSIVKRDVSLSYKLLKYINSAAFGFRTKITSTRHALVMLGINEIKKWISLIALHNLADDKPDEIMTCSVIRARLGELVAPKIGLRGCESDLFMLGLFSMIDILIGRPMSVILADLPICEQVKKALLGQACRYYDVLTMIKAYEKADWATFFRYAGDFGLNENEMPELYVQALEWTNNFLVV